MMKADQAKRLELQKIKINDLVFIKTLGNNIIASLPFPTLTLFALSAFGQFGPVYLVKANYDKNLYALKSFNKVQITE